MNRKFPLLMAALALILAAPAAVAAPTPKLQLFGGWTQPTGDFGGAVGGGPNLGAELDWSLNEVIAIGIGANWNSNEHKDVGIVDSFGFRLDEDKFTTIHVGAHARFMFPLPDAPIHPYGVLGFGMYNITEDYRYTDTTTGDQYTEEDDEAAGFYTQIGSRFGGRAGVGVMLPATPKVGIGLEASYHYVTLEEPPGGGSSSAEYISVHAGVMFGFGGGR